MKHLLVLITASLLLASCAKNLTPSGKSAGGGAPEEAVHEVMISKLISVDDLMLNNGTQSVDSQLNLVLNEKRSISKTIKISNNTTADKNLALSISGEGLSLVFNQCPGVLSPGKTCSVRVAFDPGSRYNNMYSGSLNVTSSGVVPIFVAYSVANNDAPTTDGSVTDLAFSMPNTFQDFVTGSIIPVRRVIITNSTNKEIQNVSYNTDPEYGIILSKCSTTLKAHESCYLYVYYKDIKNTPDVNQSSIKLSNNSQTREYNLYAPIFIPTYSQYSPLNPVMGPCDGQIIGNRTITQCIRQDNNQPTSISSCTDAEPTKVYLSPAGDKTTSIAHGSLIQSCNEGLSVAYNTVRVCFQGYKLLGQECVLDGVGNFSQNANQEYQASGNYRAIINVDSALTTQQVGDKKIIYLME